MCTFTACMYLFYVLCNSILVVCSEPCVNGACVANDTCNCAEGYTGSTCDVQSKF